MKKTITILMMLIGLTSFSQTNITNILNETCDFSGGCNLRLGCCYDGTDHANAGCDSEQGEPTIYYVNEDINFNRDELVIGNVIVEFRNGANFISNGAELNFCQGEFIFIGGGAILQTVEGINASLSLPFFKLIKSLPIGENYEIIDMTGRVVKHGIVDANTKAIRSKDQLLLIKVKGFKASKIPF